MRRLVLIVIALAACKESPKPVGELPRAEHYGQPPRSGRIVLPPASRSGSTARSDAVFARAEAERLGTAAGWDLAAERYQVLVDACSSPNTECRDDAYAAALARSNAARLEGLARPSDLEKPMALPPRIQALVEANDRFLELAPADDPEVPVHRFLSASAYTRYGWDADAMPRLEAVIRNHPQHEVAEYASNVMLDALNRAERYDELRLWVKVMLGDEVLLAGKPELRELLERLRRSLSLHGER